MNPVISLRRDPIIKVKILPILSARVVRYKEMAMSPTTMPVCIQLLVSSLNPLLKRFWKKMTASMP